ncbi:hypothetical protein VK70_00755 [Paenibacillus durus ATCC 35681]|uniref:Uncharacterized protein n=1 Tax=Paenibacillus durus ATCC 35681 TaxID=1333534 RepID=A0A0F7F7C6_PAEDU|nr:hypothetical protein VK70_00755 [Paenibacillus durus ATCC 35681]
MKQTTKVLLASLIGSTIEWYDFFLYGTVCQNRMNQRVPFFKQKNLQIHRIGGDEGFFMREVDQIH